MVGGEHRWLSRLLTCQQYHSDPETASHVAVIHEISQPPTRPPEARCESEPTGLISQRPHANQHL
jgi:hypothetical protein